MGTTHTKSARRNGADTVRRHKFATCRATGKLRYRDAHQAHHALLGAQRQAAFELAHFGTTSRLEIRAYGCGSCGGFHLTSEVKRSLRTRLEGRTSLESAIPEHLSAIRRIAAACAISLPQTA